MEQNKAKNIKDEEQEVCDMDPDRLTPKHSNRSNCLQRMSSAITKHLEAGFFHVGHFVGEYPVLIIVNTLIVCGLCGIALKTFKETEEQDKLWVPRGSRVLNEKAWVDRTFPDNTRFVAIIVESSSDILTPDFLCAMVDIYSRSVGISVSGLRFGDFCLRVGSHCRMTNLLGLWNYNSTTIRHLKRADILNTINSADVRSVLGYDISTLVGGHVIRSNGSIVQATATQMIWVTSGYTEQVKEWEAEMINIGSSGYPNISKTYVYASRSFDDEGYGAVDKDVKLLTAGFSIVFIFVLLSLGRFNLLEQKVYVSLAGMLCIGLSLLFAYGLATAMDLSYSRIQSIMPFMLLGIGVDDMFVIIEAWKNLNPEERGLSIPDKIGTALRQAGVSITVTSVTDAVAFGVGASTVIPALMAFCLYAVLGIFALFILVATFFTACLALDERRRRRDLDACILCYKHTDYKPNSCSQGLSLLQIFFLRWYGPFLMKLPVKVCVIIITLILLAVNSWSFSKLKQEFDLSSYIPSDSYAYQFMAAKEKLFSSEGVNTAVYCGEFNYSLYKSRLEAMYVKINRNQYVQNGSVNAWFVNFHAWASLSGIDLTDERQYVNGLNTFLTTVGQSLSPFLVFDNPSKPTKIIGSYISLRHTLQVSSAGEVEAMDSLRAVVDRAGLPKYPTSDLLPVHKCFAYTGDYMTYETNKVLLGELYRNLLMAGGSVLVVTWILIANIWTSVLVFFCVICTVVDLGGVLQFWGTSIDTASSILMTLSVGLAVDYSAHIGHTFMTIAGPRNERTIAALHNIGPAVFNGGFSTFLAFVLLANSSSYGFVVFFRVFSIVVVFGLYHGLCFLPVMLSLVGPPAYTHADTIPVSRQLSVPKRDRPADDSTQPNAFATNSNHFELHAVTKTKSDRNAVQLPLLHSEK